MNKTDRPVYLSRMVWSALAVLNFAALVGVARDAQALALLNMVGGLCVVVLPWWEQIQAWLHARNRHRGAGQPA